MSATPHAADELASLLHEAYTTAPRGDKTLCVHLWAIEFADELGEYPGKVMEVIRLAGIPNYEAAINDARKLARYVTRK